MIAWFARHQTAANLLMAAIMILGLVALPGLQRETLPEIKNDEVEVRVIYKGATADEVEDAVCRRLEDVLESITDLDEMRCDAREGVGTATAVMREGADMMRFLDDVKSEVDAIDDFPDQTEPPVIEELGRTEPVISVAVTGPEDPVALKAYAEDLKDRMMAGDRGGGRDGQRFLRPPHPHRAAGLAAAPVRPVRRGHRQRRGPAQRGQPGRAPGGRARGPAAALRRPAQERRGLPGPGGDLRAAAVRPSAWARSPTITDRFDRDEEKILFNGQRAAVLDVAKTRAQDILRCLAR